MKHFNRSYDILVAQFTEDRKFLFMSDESFFVIVSHDLHGEDGLFVGVFVQFRGRQRRSVVLRTRLDSLVTRPNRGMLAFAEFCSKNVLFVKPEFSRVLKLLLQSLAPAFYEIHGRCWPWQSQVTKIQSTFQARARRQPGAFYQTHFFSFNNSCWLRFLQN